MPFHLTCYMLGTNLDLPEWLTCHMPLQLTCRMPLQLPCHTLGINLDLLARLTCHMPSQLTCRVRDTMRYPRTAELRHTLADNMTHVGSQSKSLGAAYVPHARATDVPYVGCHEISWRRWPAAYARS